jgi:flagellar biosynthesis protein FlhB
VLVVVGAVDYLLKRRAHFKRLRMTREEVKREHREEEGDPRHKAERRRVHRRLLQEAAMRAVPRASVVITNPTHLAVALRYERGAMRAPAVTAKGQHLHAEQIRSLARTHGVPIRRDPPLARALYELELEEEIPEALYDAVAEVLRVLADPPTAAERKAAE